MSSNRENRNAQAARVLGVVGVLALLWLIAVLLVALPTAKDIGTYLSEQWHLVFLATILLFFTIKNFQIARSPRS